MEIPEDQVLCGPESEEGYECGECLVSQAPRIGDENIKPQQPEEKKCEKMEQDEHDLENRTIEESRQNEPESNQVRF